MKDSHYTPEILSDRLISYIDFTNIRTIADFCVGNGSLLKSAQKKKNEADFFGSDISKHVLEQLRKNNSDWHLSHCDFINAHSRNRSSIFKNNKNGFDLILLNPPFSCRGGTTYNVELNGTTYKVSTSMLFLVESIKYLSENGALYAILPASVAYSLKDSKVWSTLVSNYNLQILEEPDISNFKNCSPNVILVSINTKVLKEAPNDIKFLHHNLKELVLFRGKVCMQEINGTFSKGCFLIHSTNLKYNRIVDLSRKFEAKYSEISGPAVLLPRVGTPDRRKLCAIKKGECYTLSDCVIGIKVKEDLDAELLKTLLLDSWNSLERMYKGTGAKYLTLKKLGGFLNIRNNNYEQT